MSDAGSTEDDPAVYEDELDEIAASIAAAATEADLDAVDAELDEIEAAIEAAEFPAPPEAADDDETPPDPVEELTGRIDEARDAIEEQRGPYAEDIISALTSGVAEIEQTEWAEEGKREVDEAVNTLISDISPILDVAIEFGEDSSIDAQIAAVQKVIDTIEDATLDPDEDTESIEAGLEVGETFASAIDAATAFTDLPVREQLQRKGFFDILAHYKDFPPEWSAIKAHEEARNVEMILLAYDLLDSNFMEEHCIDALRRLGDEKAVEPMMALAKRRDQDAIEVLGKIGSEEPVEQLLDYVDFDSDPRLRRVTMKALGEIGSHDTTNAIAQQLRAEEPSVRSSAARALGMIGDTRAIDPLETVLEEDAAEFVRGSAAWALAEIGTERAIDILEDYDRDPSFLVESEAKKTVTTTAK